MSGRRACLTCGATYHTVYAKPVKEGICDKCGASLVLREDDKPETVKQRLLVYQRTDEAADRLLQKGKCPVHRGRNAGYGEGFSGYHEDFRSLRKWQ